MAEKKPMIVIKKITVVQGGAHGGAWKVAFADFMTAMMAFFLVMWLLATSSKEQKSAISDYFSTPSVIEYQFNNFGVELTLEKLFLDLINEPLSVFKQFVTPVDRTPNIMAMGMKKVVMAHMAEELGSIAGQVEVGADSVVFEIPDQMMFEKGSAKPNGKFVEVMERVRGVTAGLEDSEVLLSSVVYADSVSDGMADTARTVAEERVDLIEAKVRAALESPSVDVNRRAVARTDIRSPKEIKGINGGYLRVEIKQKKNLPENKKPRELSDGIFADADEDKSVYDNFVNQVSKRKAGKDKKGRK